MKKRLLAMLLALVMVLGMLPAIASADEITAPTIVSASLTLESVLSMNITVDLLDDDPANYELYAAIGADESTLITEYTATDDGKCVYTMDLMAHRACETVNLSLESGGHAFSSFDWTLADYVSSVKTDYAADTAMCNLVDALYHYCQYADYYEDTAMDGLVIDAVANVKADDLGAYAQDIQIANSALKPMAYLYLDEACDLGFKFDKTAMENKTLYVDGAAVTVSEVGTEQVGYKIPQILPQEWDTMHEVIVKDGDTVIFQISYGVLSYARQVLLRSAEIKPDLKGLTASMYLYNQAADAYLAEQAMIQVTLGTEIKRDRWHEFELFLVGDDVKLTPANSGLTVCGEVLLDGATYETWFVVSDYDWETGNYALSIKTSDGRLWDSEEERNADAAANVTHTILVKAGTTLTTTEGIVYKVTEDAAYTASLLDGEYKWRYDPEASGKLDCVSATLNSTQTTQSYISFTMSETNGFEAENWDLFVTVPAGATYNDSTLQLKRAGGGTSFYVEGSGNAAAGDTLYFPAGNYYSSATYKGITLTQDYTLVYNGSAWELTTSINCVAATIDEEQTSQNYIYFTVSGSNGFEDLDDWDHFLEVPESATFKGNALQVKAAGAGLGFYLEGSNEIAVGDSVYLPAGNYYSTVTYTGINLAQDYTLTWDGTAWIAKEAETGVTLSQTVKRDWWWGLEMYLEGENVTLTAANSNITVSGNVLLDGITIDPWFVVSDYDWGTGNYPINIKTDGKLWSSQAEYNEAKAAGEVHWLTVKAGTTLTVESTTYTVAEDAHYCISLEDGEYKWRAASNEYAPVTLNPTVTRYWWWGIEMYLDGTEDVFTANSGITVAGPGEYVDGAAASPWFVVSDYDWDTGKYPIIIKTENIWANEEAYNADAAAGVEHTVTVQAGTLLTIDGKVYTVTEDISYLISTMNGEYKWRQVKEVTLGQEIKRDRWHEFEMFLVGDNVKLAPANSGITVIGDVLLNGTKIDPWFVVSDWAPGEDGNYLLSIKTSDGKVWADSAAYEADKAAGTEHHITVKAGTKLLTSEGVLYKITEDANYRISLIDGAYNWRYTTEGYTPDVELTEYALTADSKIIVPVTAGTTTTYAANELQSFLAQTSGLTLEIAEQGTALNSDVLNFSLNDQGACPAIADGKTDSFATVMDGGVLHIYGGSERGVLYGVYDFLEDKLGVRFISSAVTYVPTLSQIVVAADYSVTETPAVNIRSYWTTETQADAVFAARKRMVTVFESNPVDGGMARDYYNPGHNLNSLITLGGGTVPSQVCLSDSTLRGYLVAGMKTLIAQNPSASYFALKLEDGYDPTSCTCGTCSGKSDSDLLMDLCNYVAQQVNADSDREIYIVTYAYGTTEVPPTIDVDSHVVVELAPISNANFGFAYNDSRQSDAFKNSVAGWQAKVPGRLWFYDYGTNYNNYSWYLSDLSLMLTNYQYMANTLGSDSIIVEGNHVYQNDWQQALRVYVASKLLWNPNGYTQADVMALVEEFCTYYFGDAAVYQYIVAMENNMATIRNDDSYFVAASDHTLSGTNYQTDTSGVQHTLNANYYDWYTADFIKSQITSLEAAYNGAAGAQKDRIAQVLFTAKLMYFANYVKYENKSTWLFKYDTYRWDDTYTALKTSISDLLTVLDNGYANGSYRSFYNSLLFKSMLEIAGSDKDATLVPGSTQGITFLTNAADGTAAGIYVWLEQDGEERITSDWTAVSGTSTATIVHSTTGASKTVTVKGTGVNSRFFFDYDGFAGSEGETAVITLTQGTVVDNGYTWNIASDITIGLLYTGGKWTVATGDVEIPDYSGTAILTAAENCNAAGIYMWLVQDGEERATSEWSVVSGTASAQIVNNTTGATKTVTVKGTGPANRFFCDYDGFAGNEGETATITISVGTIIDNGYTWNVASEITITLTYNGTMWSVASE